MIAANFPQGKTEIKIPALTQWDKYQKLAISGLDNTDNVFQVHFCNAGSKQAIVRIAYQNNNVHEVDIPNSLLKDKLTIFAYVYLTDYEQAAEVNELTEGEYFTKSGDVYTKVTLPREYVGGMTYYKQKGTTVKTIIIPVIARKKPDDYIDEGDPSSEVLLEELLRYCQNLGYRLDYYSKQVVDYKNQKWVYTMTTEDYEALVAAGKVQDNVLYGIEDQELYDVIKEGIEKGEISIGKSVESEHAETADDSGKINGLKISTNANDNLTINDDSGDIVVRKKRVFSGSISNGAFNFKLQHYRTYEIEVFGNITIGEQTEEIRYRYKLKANETNAFPSVEMGNAFISYSGNKLTIRKFLLTPNYTDGNNQIALEERYFYWESGYGTTERSLDGCTITIYQLLEEGW